MRRRSASPALRTPPPTPGRTPIARTARRAILAALLPAWSTAAFAQVATPAAAPVPAIPTRFTATVDAGAASVRYDEFLRSSVLIVSPGARLDFARGSAEATGAVSRFPSGNESWQGTLAGTFLQPFGTGWTAEGGASGTSIYYSGAEVEGDIGGQAGNLVGTLRLHRQEGRQGLWAGATGGLVTDGFTRSAVVVGELAAWTFWRDVSLLAQVRPTTAGSQARFVDAELAARWWWRGRLELSGSAGARDGDLLAGARVWGELGAVAWLTRHAALVIGWGRYPADVVQGAPGARYATAALRVASRPPPRLEASARATSRAPRPTPLALIRAFPAGDFSTRRMTDGRTVIRVRAPEAGLVELMGDFTDWEPVPLVRGDDGSWERAFALPTGTWRFNVRRDGGAWEVPSGATAIEDDFGGTAALLVVG